MISKKSIFLLSVCLLFSGTSHAMRGEEDKAPSAPTPRTLMDNVLDNPTFKSMVSKDPVFKGMVTEMFKGTINLGETYINDVKEKGKGLCAVVAIPRRVTPLRHAIQFMEDYIKTAESNPELSKDYLTNLITIKDETIREHLDPMIAQAMQASYSEEDAPDAVPAQAWEDYDILEGFGSDDAQEGAD